MDLHIATNPTDDTSSSRKDAYWGIALQASELLSTFAYMVLVKFWPSESAPTHDFAQLLFASDAEKALVMGKEKDAKPIEVGEITLKYLNRDPPSSEEHAISLPANDEVAANEIASLAALGVNITKRIDPKELERVLSKVKGEKDSGVPWINYMVVDTDYNNFVILYSCTEYLANALKFDYIWVLTRKPWDEKSKEWKVLYQ